MPYLINGSTASVVPYKQTWSDVVMATDHNGAAILSGFKVARLEFDSGTQANANQWLQFCNTGTSLTSLEMLNLDGTSFVSLSGVFLGADRPIFEAGYVGPFTVIVNRCSF